MEISKGKLQTEVKKTDLPSPVKVEDSGSESVAYNVTDNDEKHAVCRVCQCVESDNGGDVVLGFLGIVPPSQDALKINESGDDKITIPPEVVKKTPSENESMPEPGFIEFISPDGEIFICRNDVEASSCYQPDMLINLGCSCKSDLSLAHYACALKWFVNHGSSVCEICGTEAKYIRPEDIKKVMASIDENESLVSGIATGECSHVRVKANAGVDPDAIAAIRRQRLSEISMWFNLSSTSAMNSRVVTDQPLVIPSEDVVPSESLRTKWAVEGTAILVATGLLTVTLAWLIAPRVGKQKKLKGERLKGSLPTSRVSSIENCKKWSSHPAWRHLCFDTCYLPSLYFVVKDQIWTSTILGNIVCVLVSCIWYLGIKNSWCTHYLKL